MAQARYYEDYVVGEARETMGRTMTETDFVVHAGHTGDFFPHHMDAEVMKFSSFGQRIAHGTMTFAIGIGLTAAEVNPKAFTYGYDKLRFPRPVFIGDTIRTQLTIASKELDPRRSKHGRVVESCRVINQRGETVLACEHVLLVELRPVAPMHE
jgi:acyl dehydratase